MKFVLCAILHMKKTIEKIRHTIKYSSPQEKSQERGTCPPVILFSFDAKNDIPSHPTPTPPHHILLSLPFNCLSSSVNSASPRFNRGAK